MEERGWRRGALSKRLLYGAQHIVSYTPAGYIRIVQTNQGLVIMDQGGKEGEVGKGW